MKRFTIYFITISLIFLLASCGKEDQDDTLSRCETFIDSMNFDSMEVGDQFKFVFFIGENYFNDELNGFYFTGDTLVLEVLQVDGYEKIISEKLTPGSRSFLNDTSEYYAEADSHYINKWLVRPEFMRLEKEGDEVRSHLMHKHLIEYPKSTARRASFDQWKMVDRDQEGVDDKSYIIYGAQFGECEFFKLFAYTDIITYHIHDALLYVTIYHRAYGIVSSYWLSSGNQIQPRGWLRLMDN